LATDIADTEGDLNMSDPLPEGGRKAYIPIVVGDDSTGIDKPPPWKPTPKPTKTPPPSPTPTATATVPAPASQRIAIDPITRIEGHLRLEVQIDNGRVTDAWSAGMMFRGIELLLPGRDPRDAWVFAQRICGV
jgi:hypothetical protein